MFCQLFGVEKLKSVCVSLLRIHCGNARVQTSNQIYWRTPFIFEMVNIFGCTVFVLRSSEAQKIHWFKHGPLSLGNAFIHGIFFLSPRPIGIKIGDNWINSLLKAWKICFACKRSNGEWARGSKREKLCKQQVNEKISKGSDKLDWLTENVSKINFWWKRQSDER